MKKNNFKIKPKRKKRKKNNTGKGRQKRWKNERMLLVLLSVLLFLILFGYFLRNEFKTESGLFKSSTRISVIDVSQWEGTIDWKKVKNSDIRHAILKIGSGDYDGEGFHEDPLFQLNYENAVRENISCGVYFFSYAVTADEAKREALYCLELLEKYYIKPSDLFFPVAFDLEYDKALRTGRRNCTDMTLAFCKTMEAAGFEPMIYSSASYLKDYLIYREIEDYKLWVANYEAAGPAFGKPYVMWQYSEDGRVDGIEDLCDMNYWYTNYIEVQELKAGTDSLTLKKGKKQTLDIKILPANATNQRLAFASSNEKVVKILDTQKGTIKAAGSGTAWITIETPSGIKERIRVKVE